MKKRYLTSLQNRATGAVKEKLIREININEPNDDGIPFFGNNFTKEELKNTCDNVRKRVSGYSKEKKAELLKKARKIIKNKK